MRKEAADLAKILCVGDNVSDTCIKDIMDSMVPPTCADGLNISQTANIESQSSAKLKNVDKPRVFGKGEDYALAFQSGKGLNDQLLQRMILGRHLRKENALWCIYDEEKSDINFKDFGKDWPQSRRKPTPSDAKLYWQHLEDREKWIKPRVGGHWFWGFMRNSKRIYEVSKQKDIPFYFSDQDQDLSPEYQTFQSRGPLLHKDAKHAKAL